MLVLSWQGTSNENYNICFFLWRNKNFFFFFFFGGGGGGGVRKASYLELFGIFTIYQQEISI